MENKDLQAWAWLNENELGYDIWSKKYRYNGESFEAWLDRVSMGDAEIKELIRARKLLFGGRTLASLGTGNGQSYSNCYSSGYAPDSVEGIMELNKKLALTFKAGGGQGVSLTQIRPKGAPVKGGIFKSDGIVPFMEIFNQTTASISQGGNRKGAIMMSLSVWHPEIETFITIKKGNGAIKKANLSVEIDNHFMELVKIGCTEYTYMHEMFGQPATINPVKIYDLIMQSAHSSAEPGVLFVDSLRSYNLMQYHHEYKIITTNPCGEQPLPEQGSCNLGSMNLAEYVVEEFTSNATFDFETFKKDVHTSVKALDFVLEKGKNLHALQEQRDMAHNYRNIGLGVMGLGTMYMKLGLAYGSQKANQLLEEIMFNLFNEAVIASALLAKEYGTFPKFSSDVLDAEILDNVSDEAWELATAYGLRNCSLISVAPTGSIGTMLNISTGVEPYYALSYTRKTESLHGEAGDTYYTVEVETAKKAREAFGESVCISAMNLKWKDRVDTQAIMQKYTDTAISSTVNVPEETSLEEIKDLYMYAFDKKLKGITIYREGSFEAILSTGKETEKKEEEVVGLQRGDIAEVPEGLTGTRKVIHHGCGSYTLHIYKDREGKLFDCFLTSKSQGCQSNVQSITVLLSLLLRSGVTLDRIEKAINGLGACPSFVAGAIKGKCGKGKSCGSAIILALKEAVATTPEPTKKGTKTCPECGAGLNPEGGCWSCNSCGFTYCG